MPPSSSHSPRRKRTRRYLSTSSLQGTRWNRSPSSSHASPERRRRFSTSSDPFTLSPDNGSEADAFDHDSGLEDEASVISNPETFDVLHSSSAKVPLTYSSLPPTPISSSPLPGRSPSPTLSPQLPPYPEVVRVVDDAAQFSLWDYLREELLATDFDSHQELKWERVSNFLSMPIAVEKVTFIPHTIQGHCQHTVLRS